MNFFTPAEVIANYAASSRKKTALPAWKMILMGIVAGTFIALGCATTNTSSHSLTDVSTARTISGLLFPGGISMVILMGVELFTGNCMMVLSVMDKKIKALQMLKNWVFVYLGNFIGSMIVAFACANSGQFNYSDGGLAVYTMKLGATKTSLTFGHAVVLGIFCNVLVCFAVLSSLAAKDVAGRILGTFLPIAFFIICGFEHCVANMYYIPAGIFASHIPAYAAKAAAAGLDLSSLTWGNFLAHNLLPVTLGNIIGGAAVGAVMWICFAYKGKKQTAG